MNRLRVPFPLAAVLALTAALTVFRSAVPVFFEQANFDSDQAVMGLMAKHVAEGRAFPLFQYAHDYVLVVEAWLAAPVVALFGASVASLKLPLLVMNVSVALLLIVLLVREAGLTPWQALVASSFFVLPSPITSADLVQALGGNIEPFLYVLLLWVLRDRPAAFGVVLAVGFLNREFTAYAVPALLAVQALDRTLFTREAVRRWLATIVTFAAVWQVIRSLKPYADALGPGSADPFRTETTTNVGVLATFFCWDLGRAVQNVGDLAARQFASLLGARVDPLVAANVNSTLVQGVSWLWPILVGAAVLMVIRLAGRQTVADLSSGGVGAFCFYLMLVGLQAAVLYATSRCGDLSLYILRYLLLGLFLPIGLTAWYLARERRRAMQVLVVGVVLTSAAVNLRDHAALQWEYLRDPPLAHHRDLADELRDRGIRFARAEYWTAYHVTYLTQEQVIVAAEGFLRIEEYERLVRGHADQAVIILRQPCPAEGVQVHHWHLCGTVPDRQARGPGVR